MAFFNEEKRIQRDIWVISTLLPTPHFIYSEFFFLLPSTPIPLSHLPTHACLQRDEKKWNVESRWHDDGTMEKMSIP